MNPQCGFYQNTGAMGMNRGQGQGYRQQQQVCCDKGYIPGEISAAKFTTATVCRVPSGRTRSNYGFNSQQPARRAPPVFASSSSANCSSAQFNRNQQQQQRCWNRAGNGGNPNRRIPQQRSARTMQNYAPVRRPEDCKLPYRQQQFQCNPHANQHPLRPAPYCTPQAIKVNVTAEQLETAKNTPIFPNRAEASQEDNPNVKYIQLNWNDLLGGMENLRVSMVPSGDPCQNQQLKVSFGGQRTDPPAAGETSLKVVSLEPVNAGRMNIEHGNALAGHMKICNSPTNVRMAPVNRNNAQQRQQQGQNYYGGNGSNYCPPKAQSHALSYNRVCRRAENPIK